MTVPISHDRLDSALHAAVERLRAFAPVESVILFGSRARGDHREDSDWDLCVLLPDDIPAGIYTPGSMWQAVRDLGLAIQVVPMRTSVFEDRRHDVNALAHDVAEDGIVLFDASGATAFRYPADDPLTRQPLPTKQDIELSLDEAEQFIEAAALQISSPRR